MCRARIAIGDFDIYNRWVRFGELLPVENVSSYTDGPRAWTRVVEVDDDTVMIGAKYISSNKWVFSKCYIPNVVGVAAGGGMSNVPTKVAGIIGGQTGLVVGEEYYVHPLAGTLTKVPWWNKARLGRAISSTEIVR
jgi:hypothetical protein